MYTLRFHESAEKEWLRLDKGIRDRLLKVLERRLAEPRILSAQLSGDLEGLYNIKAYKSGYRLVYEVFDDVLIVLVIAVGKREDFEVYKNAEKRFNRVGKVRE